MTTFFLIYAIGVIIVNYILFDEVNKGERKCDISEYTILSALSWMTIGYMIGIYLKTKNNK